MGLGPSRPHPATPPQATPPQAALASSGAHFLPAPPPAAWPPSPLVSPAGTTAPEEALNVARPGGEARGRG